MAGFNLTDDAIFDNDFSLEENIIETPTEGKEKEENKEKEDKTTEEISFTEDELFGDSEDESDNPESVGSNKKNNKSGGDKAKDADSPNNKKVSTYSSLAKAMKGDNLFQNLDDEVIDNISDADSFAEAMEKEIEARLDNSQRRVTEALNANVPVNVIKSYENVIGQLNGITEEMINEESDRGATLRQNLIYRDFINRGFSDAKAKKMLQASFNDGSDIDDAIDALESCKAFYNNKYNDIIEEGKEQENFYKQEIKKQSAELKNKLLDTNELFGGITVDKKVRQKAYDAITKPIHTTEDGRQLTAIQKYAEENPVDWRVAISTLYTMTDGFTKMDNFFNKAVNKKVRTNLRSFEDKVLNQRLRGGNLDFIGGSGDDSNEEEGWQLDV